jgi:hypothetical protein
VIDLLTLFILLESLLLPQIGVAAMLSAIFAHVRLQQRVNSDAEKRRAVLLFHLFKSRKQRYRYEKLKEKHIRLLKLQPGVGKDHLRCTLQAVDLLAYDDIGAEASIEGLERYEAISYVWGDSHHTVEIECKLSFIFIKKRG